MADDELLRLSTELGAALQKRHWSLALAESCTGGWASQAVTGIAGPDGGTPDKPVGTVCFAWASADGILKSETLHFEGDREAVRYQSVKTALEGVLDLTLVPDL